MKTVGWTTSGDNVIDELMKVVKLSFNLCYSFSNDEEQNKSHDFKIVFRISSPSDGQPFWQTLTLQKTMSRDEIFGMYFVVLVNYYKIQYYEM